MVAMYSCCHTCHLLLVAISTGPSAWPQQVWECANRGPERYKRRPFCPQRNDSPDSPQIARLQPSTALFVSWLTLIICSKSPPKILSKGNNYLASKLHTLLPFAPFLSIKSGIKTTPRNRPQCFKVPKIRCNSCKIPLEGTKPPLLRQAPLKINILIFLLICLLFLLILIQ